MFRRREEDQAQESPPERVDSVLGRGVAWKGDVSGVGGLRIEGAFDGNITLRGLVVVAETGRVTCKEIRAHSVIVAGSVRGDITARKVTITRTGRVWGDVVTTSFSTEEGAFLRGQITMEEELDLGLPEAEPPAFQPAASPEEAPEETPSAD